MTGEAIWGRRIKAAEVHEPQRRPADRVAAGAALERSRVEVPVREVGARVAQHVRVEVVDGQVEPALVDKAKAVCVAVVYAIENEALTPPVEERVRALPHGEKATVELPEAQEGVLV